MKQTKDFQTCFDKNKKPTLWFKKVLALYLFCTILLHSFFGFFLLNLEHYYPLNSANHKSIFADLASWAMWQCSGPIAILLLGKCAREGISLFGLNIFLKKRVINYGKEILFVLTPVNIIAWLFLSKVTSFDYQSGFFYLKLNHLWFFWYLLLFNFLAFLLVKYLSFSRVFKFCERSTEKHYQLILWLLPFAFLFFSPIPGFIGNPANKFFIDPRLLAYHSVFFFLGFFSASSKNFAEIGIKQTFLSLFLGLLGVFSFILICSMNVFFLNPNMMRIVSSGVTASTMLCLMNFISGCLNFNFPKRFFNLISRVLDFGYGFNFPIITLLFWITNRLDLPMWLSIIGINTGFWLIAYLFNEIRNKVKNRET